MGGKWAANSHLGKNKLEDEKSILKHEQPLALKYILEDAVAFFFPYTVNQPCR